MDYPIFHFDFIGGRLLIAFIAVLHVLINHALAVGLIPLIVYLEHLGFKRGDKKLDTLAYRIMFFAFLITTTVGAMTGVGIWLSTSLVNPASIGSLIRVFYTGWAVEWLVFVTEVILIMIYFLSWKKSHESVATKKRHIRFGVALATASWFTMAIIVAILGFMMDTGNWAEHHSLLNGFTNPIYLPQLAFRTPLALLMAGTVVLLLTQYFTKNDQETRHLASRKIGGIMLAHIPLAFAAAVWYYGRIPTLMIGNLQVAVATQDFQEWYGLLMKFVWSALSVTAVVSVLPFFKPNALPRWAYIVPVIGMMAFAGLFERLREFIRKPYVIGEYMYSNAIRVQDLPLFQRDGILTYAAYARVHEVTPENMLTAGEDLFMLTCSKCHTTNGVNNVTEKFEIMYGGAGIPLGEKGKAMETYIQNMHNARYFMPPFPGNEKEIKALVAYIQHLQVTPGDIHPAQTDGVTPVVSSAIPPNSN